MELQMMDIKRVKVEIELSRFEIGMFLRCIEAAIDTKHVVGQDLKRVKEIREQLSRYL